ILDMDYIGWKYRFPSEGIVVVINIFDDIVFNILNWKLCGLLERDDNKISFNPDYSNYIMYLIILF
ncbi:MAG: hypothetical protein ACXWCZ_10110, partial [Flavisolibacter sp.]